MTQLTEENNITNIKKNKMAENFSFSNIEKYKPWKSMLMIDDEEYYVINIQKHYVQWPHIEFTVLSKKDRSMRQIYFYYDMSYYESKGSFVRSIGDSKGLFPSTTRVMLKEKDFDLVSL